MDSGTIKLLPALRPKGKTNVSLCYVKPWLGPTSGEQQWLRESPIFVACALPTFPNHHANSWHIGIESRTLLALVFSSAQLDGIALSAQNGIERYVIFPGTHAFPTALSGFLP